MQKALLGDPMAISAGEALYMATVGGAKVLGQGRNIGSLETGKQADLILVRLGQPHLTPVHDPVSLLVYAANGADVDTTIVAGRVLMRGRKLTTIDEAALVRDAEICARRLAGRS